MSAATSLTRQASGSQQIDSPTAIINDLLVQAEEYKRKWQTALSDLEKLKVHSEAVEVSYKREIARLEAKIEERDAVIPALEGRIKDLQPWDANDEVNEAFDNVSLGEPGGTERDYDGDDEDEDAATSTRPVSATSDNDFINLTFPLALEDNGIWRFATNEEMRGNIDLDLVRAQSSQLRRYFYGLWRTLGMGSDGRGEGECEAVGVKGEDGVVGEGGGEGEEWDLAKYQIG
jgi:hypothetical protein